MTRETGAVVTHTRRRTWVLLGFCGVILAALVWSALGGPGLGSRNAPESPPLPVPNGYDDVLEAGRAIEASGTVGSKLDTAKADEAILISVRETNRDAITRARKGLEKPFQVPVVYQMDYVYNVLMRDLGTIRAVARALTTEGRLAAFEGKFDAATQSFLDQVRLGEAIGRRVPMLAYLTSVAVGSTGLHNLRDVRDKLSPDECRRVIGLLEEVDRNHQPAAEVAARETQFMNANLRKMGVFASITMQMSGILAKNVGQVEATLESSVKRQAAARRVLLTDLALRVYRLEYGEDPPDLATLVPSILKSVPVDPYSGKPLRYVKRGKEGVVFSVGPDRDDDNLARPLPLKHVDTADGDFTIDSF
jgi:hypothetical protein